MLRIITYFLNSKININVFLSYTTDLKSFLMSVYFQPLLEFWKYVDELKEKLPIPNKLYSLENRR